MTRNYVVLGVEAFKVAEVKGVFCSRTKAQEMADLLEKQKNKQCCQRYTVKSWTQANKEFTLYT